MYGLSLDDPFFWDTVQLASKQAHYFYQSAHNNLALETTINSGHIPAFGWYLSNIWTLFGKTLMVSHLSIFPFLLIYIVCVFLISKHLFEGVWVWIAYMLLLYEPCFVAQSNLVSPDVVLIAMVALSFYGLLRKKMLLVSVAAVFLTLISMRGIMFVAVLFLVMFWQHKPSFKFKDILVSLKWFVPSILVFSSYYVFHYIQEGWVFYHEASPWAESFKLVDIKGIVKNGGLVVWRFLDFGKWPIFCLLPFFMLSVKEKNESVILVFRCLVLSILIIVGITVFYKGLTAHRYFMPIYFFAILLFISYLQELSLKYVYKISIAVLALISFASGHFWKYPEHVAQGWDATLAYKDHIEGMDKLKEYLADHTIELSEVGCYFPFLASQEMIYLNGEEKSLAKMDLQHQNYALYSNICNDISDEETQALKTHWLPIFSYSKRAVLLTLYQRN